MCAAETARSMNACFPAVRFRLYNVFSTPTTPPEKNFLRGAHVEQTRGKHSVPNNERTCAAQVRRARHLDQSPRARLCMLHSTGAKMAALDLGPTLWPIGDSSGASCHSAKSTPRDGLIDTIARGVVEAWRLAPRPNVTWPCWLGTIS